MIRPNFRTVTLLALALAAAPSMAAAADVSGSVTATSDYVFRGVDLDDALADSYQHASLGVTWTHGAFSVRGTGHLPSDSAEDLFGDVGAPRLELAAAWSF